MTDLLKSNTCLPSKYTLDAHRKPPYTTPNSKLRLALHARSEQLIVTRFPRHQLHMRAVLHNLSLGQNIYRIRVPDRAHTVDDRDGRNVRACFLKRILDEGFGLRVDCRRRFVEDEDSRVSDECSS